MSVVSLPYDHPPLPFFAMDSETGNDVEINNAQDAYALFNTWEWDHPLTGERRYLFAQNAEIGAFLFDSELQDVIRRKIYCDKYPATAPFPGSYDDIPEWWLSAVNIIEQSIDEASKYVRRKNG